MASIAVIIEASGVGFAWVSGSVAIALLVRSGSRAHPGVNLRWVSIFRMVEENAKPDRLVLIRLVEL